MAAGGPNDHPLTDIVNFNLEIYNPNCDRLIREISKFVSMDTLYEMFNWIDNESATKDELEDFEKHLTNKLEQLKSEALENGWELD